MNTKLLIFIILGVALIGIGIFKFGGFKAGEKGATSDIKIEAPTGEPDATPPGSSPSSESTSTDTDKGEAVVSITKITIEGDEFSFSPKNISIARGTTVELTFKNIGRAPHNYTINELSLSTKTIGGGKTDVVTFVAPDAPGVITYTSLCSVPGHKEAGMVGTIEIK